MFYLIYNNYGEYPHIIDDVDDFIIDEEMLCVHSLGQGDIRVWRAEWDIVHLTYYSYEDYLLNRRLKNGKN